MKKTELLKLTGTLQQIAYVRQATVAEGRANGLRTVEVKNEDMRFLVLGDKAFFPKKASAPASSQTDLLPVF